MVAAVRMFKALPSAAGLALVLLTTCVFAGAARASEPAELWLALRTGEAFALMRHALAPGSGDPDNFAVADCSTQRNLDARGRAQARQVGERFRAHGIGSATVYSSLVSLSGHGHRPGPWSGKTTGLVGIDPSPSRFARPPCRGLAGMAGGARRRGTTGAGEPSLRDPRLDRRRSGLRRDHCGPAAGRWQRGGAGTPLARRPRGDVGKPWRFTSVRGEPGVPPSGQSSPWARSGRDNPVGDRADGISPVLCWLAGPMGLRGRGPEPASAG